MAEQEDALSRVATNLALIAGAISTLAEAVNGTYGGKPIYAQSGTVASVPPAASTADKAAPKPRGRPAKGGSDAPTASTAPAAAPAVVEADPFNTAPPAATVTATIDQVREALTKLSKVTSQAEALKVLKEASGVDNLTELQRTPEKYALVLAAAAKKSTPGEPAAEVDPFETGTMPAAVAPTVEDVRAALVEAGKRTSQETVQKVVMEHGGVAPAAGGGNGPSLKALPAEKYAAVIAAVKALPTTKT
jgi:hypothetical protein